MKTLGTLISLIATIGCGGVYILNNVGGEGINFDYPYLSAHGEVAVADGYAYVLVSSYSTGNSDDDPSLLVIFNVSNPANAQMLSKIELPPDARGLVVRGNYLFVGLYNMSGSPYDALRIVDVADKKNPIIIGGQNLALPGHCQGVQASKDGNWVYMSFYQIDIDTTNGFRVIDAHDKSNPISVGGENLVLPPSGRPAFLDRDDENYVFLPFYQDSTGTNGVRIVYVGDKANPVSVGGENLVLPGNCRAVWSSIKRGYAYISSEGTDSEGRLSVIKISDLTNLKEVGYTTGGFTEIWLVEEQNLIYSTGDFVDINNPKKPKIKLNFRTGNNPENGEIWGICYSDDHFYVVYQGNSLNVVPDPLRIYKKPQPIGPGAFAKLIGLI